MEGNLPTICGDWRIYATGFRKGRLRFGFRSDLRDGRKTNFELNRLFLSLKNMHLRAKCLSRSTGPALIGDICSVAIDHYPERITVPCAHRVGVTEMNESRSQLQQKIQLLVLAAWLYVMRQFTGVYYWWL